MRYSGILRIGFKLLVNDRGKFFALLIGITFAVFLMMEMTAMFAGILNRAFSPVTNIGAAMWIMDPAVNTATSPIPMPGYVLDAARSMDGVSYAVPLLSRGQCRRSGRQQPVWPARTGTGQHSGHLCRQHFLCGGRC
jgi:putative ABC transport system permease protein